MGCDIHCYVEYHPKRPRDEYARHWRDFGGRINPGRNYALFAALAGVRGPLPKGGVKPRGIPAELSYSAAGDWHLYIKDAVVSCEDWDGRLDPLNGLMMACLANPDDGTPRAMLLDELLTRHESRQADQEYTGRVGTCTHAEAERWHARGRPYVMRDGKPVMVEHPDWHTPSWLTADEWEAALKLAGVGPKAEAEYHAILAAMRALEAAGNAARVVFWFDN